MTESTDLPVPSPAEAQERLEQALFEIRRVIAGQDAMLERVVVCLLAQGHLLIEGVPGLAKTLTIKTVADVLGGTFQRVQFTPDLVPSDSMGFCVAMTRNGSGTGCVVWPIVTCRSCITSSSADWTFAGARLISSASRKLQKTGPSSVSKLPSPCR